MREPVINLKYSQVDIFNFVLDQRAEPILYKSHAMWYYHFVTPEIIKEQPKQPSREMALRFLVLADRSDDQLERLAYIQLFSNEVTALGLTAEDVGTPVEEVIAIANRSYGGSAEEASAIHTIASKIITSIPTKLS